MKYYNNYQEILDNLNKNELDLLKTLLSFTEEDNQIYIDKDLWDAQLDIAEYYFSKKTRRRTLNKFIKLKILLPVANQIAVFNPIYFFKGKEFTRLDLVRELNKVYTRKEMEYVKLTTTDKIV